MSWEQPIYRPTVKVAAATDAGLFVKFDGGKPAAGDKCIGPVYTKTAAANERAAVTMLGVAQAVAGSVVNANAGAIAAGDRLKVEATGKVVKAQANDTAVALAMEAVTEADKAFAVFVQPGL